MSEEIEEIRRRKLEELRTREETGDGSASPTPSEPVPIDGEAELDDVVGEHGVVLVDFYADWCGPCRMLEPIVESLAAETDAAVAKVDVDANQQLATAYGVRGVPTLVLFSNGEQVEEVVGLEGEAELRALVESHTAR
ncbi:thioredoxin [Halopenitus salinus]|uniref:Thioredoxin n=1 Tax=Halopenitus salinus TaxID=1198295 RepID=A0ABD5UUZ7_9EURY